MRRHGAASGGELHRRRGLGEELRRGSAAVRSVLFRVEKGEVFALLGPNGAGETTTVEILRAIGAALVDGWGCSGLDPEAAGRCWGARIRSRARARRDRKGSDRPGGAGMADRLLQPPPVGLGAIRAGRVDGQAFGAVVKTLTGLQRRSLDLALGLVGDPDLSDGGRHWLRLFADGFRSARRPARWRHHSCPWPTAGDSTGARSASS